MGNLGLTVGSLVLGKILDLGAIQTESYNLMQWNIVYLVLMMFSGIGFILSIILNIYRKHNVNIAHNEINEDSSSNSTEE